MDLGDSKETITSIPLKTVDISSVLHPDDIKRELYLKPCGGPLGYLLIKFKRVVGKGVKKNSTAVSISLKLIAVACICVYIGFLIDNFVSTDQPIDWVYGYGKAFIYIAVVFWCVIYYKYLSYYILPLFSRLTNNYYYIKHKRNASYCCLTLIVLVMAAFFIYDTSAYRRRLISLCGILVFFVGSFLFSKHPEYVRWDTAITGLILQLIMGIFAIRWDTGRSIIEGIANNIVMFLNYGHDGAIFVFGDFLINKEAVFAFQALSTLYFIAMVARVLFYLGWLQTFFFKIGGFIEFLMGTTVIESAYAATVIFLGMSEAPILCAPYIELLTTSEMHAIMASGHATVAGSLFAVYTSMGVDPRYIITASTMAAPASLCFAKLLYPENNFSRTSSENIEELKSEDSSIVDAACKGAASAVFVVQGIIASLVACIAFIAFANGTCSWLGFLVGYEGVTLEYLVGNLFVPIAWIMGVIPEECQAVGSLIGIKTMANEFLAYKELGNLKKLGKISARSEAIATFALCGFSNPGALGTNIATLTALAQGRADCINKVAIRAFITGCITTFTSACIAGLLTADEGIRNV